MSTTPAAAARQTAIALRQYQIEALTAIDEAVARGLRRLLLVLATGLGKTIVVATYIEQVVRSGGRALVLVHRDELARQAEDKIRLVMPGAAIGLVKAARNDLYLPITIASVQTLSRAERLRQLGRYDLIVIDEAHHAVAESYRASQNECMTG